jgi:hypothetical protein
MLCYNFHLPRVPVCSANVSSWLEPLLHLVHQITSYVFPHTTKQDSLPTASLISRQAVPYRTRGGTCCPGVFTPKTRSSVGLSHITWQNPAVSTITTHVQTTASILTTVTSHFDGWKTESQNNNTSQTQHNKDGKTCTKIMTAWLTITNQVKTQIPKVQGLDNNINKCRPVCILERESI